MSNMNFLIADVRYFSSDTKIILKGRGQKYLITQPIKDCRGKFTQPNGCVKNKLNEKKMPIIFRKPNICQNDIYLVCSHRLASPCLT